jgi:uncharacterized protein DUF5666
MRAPLAAILLALTTSAFAQGAPPTALRGVIESVAPDGASVTMRTREGEDKTLTLTGETMIARITAASLADIKPGVYVGAGAMPGAGGVLKALEIHIFPESLRGAGDGFHPFDLEPGSSMTNGAIQARVEEVDGPQIVVAYKGGQQTIALDPATPIVAIQPGGRDDLKAGAAIVARGKATDEGGFAARSIVVGVDGVVPPM